MFAGEMRLWLLQSRHCPNLWLINLWNQLHPIWVAFIEILQVNLNYAGLDLKKEVRIKYNK
jgi:hypothetical protein